MRECRGRRAGGAAGGAGAGERVGRLCVGNACERGGFLGGV